MHDRSRFLLVYGINWIRWAKRYDLEPFTVQCANCKELVTTDVPFAMGPLRGLMAPYCRCGHQYPPYCVVNPTDRGLSGLFPNPPKPKRRKVKKPQ